MAAGMHDAGVGGGMRHAAGLQDRQRVHVGAQPDRAVGLAAADGRDHAVAADAGDERDAKFAKPRLDEGGGLPFVQGEFGVGVQVAPPSGQPVVQGLVHVGSG